MGHWKWPDFKGNKKNFSDSNKKHIFDMTNHFSFWSVLLFHNVSILFPLPQFDPYENQKWTIFQCFHRWCRPQSEFHNDLYISPLIIWSAYLSQILHFDQYHKKLKLLFDYRFFLTLVTDWWTLKICFLQIEHVLSLTQYQLIT